MDYYLENAHMGMLEKNKEYFVGLAGEKNTNETDKNEHLEMNADTYKMFDSFMKEKEGILKIINEIKKMKIQQLKHLIN